MVLHRDLGSLGTRAHDAARDYLAARLQSLGLEPYRGESFELPYRSGKTDFANVVGTLPGSRRDLAPVLIGDHYDSVIPSHCAEDNAAAVAIALLAVTRLKDQHRSRDIVIPCSTRRSPRITWGRIWARSGTSSDSRSVFMQRSS